jgi:hypothetical protein
MSEQASHKCECEGAKRNKALEKQVKELKEIVGGYIEVVNLGDDYMVVNEEGKLIGLPFNLNATRVYQISTKIGEHIVGDVLVCPKNQIL